MNHSESLLRTNPRIVPQDLMLKFGYSPDNGIKYDSIANALSFYEGGTQRVDISSLGLAVRNGEGLVVGHTAQVTSTPGLSELQVLGTGAADASLTVGRWGASNSPPYFAFLGSRNTVIGGFTVVQSGDQLGQIVWNGDDGTDYRSIAASITGEVDGTPGTGDMPGRLVFGTTADGAQVVSEALRIDSSQNVIIAGTNKLGFGNATVMNTYIVETSNDKLEIFAGGTLMVTIDDTFGVVMNENGGAINDFRVETDNVSSAFFIDSGANLMNLNTHTKLHITDTDGTVEGSIWYDASEDKLKFKTAAGVETITSA